MTTNQAEACCAGLDQRYLCHLRLERCKLSISHLYALLYACNEKSQDIMLDECVQVLQAIESDMSYMANVLDTNA